MKQIIVSVCAWCKKPLHDATPEDVARATAAQQISHGICGTCVKQVESVERRPS